MRRKATNSTRARPVPSTNVGDGRRRPLKSPGGVGATKDRAPVAHAAYAELILTLVDARSDPATTRFDYELAEAVDGGRIDEQTARALRWWQRESVRGVRDHLADVLPPLLDALESSAARSATTFQSSAELWRAAFIEANAAPHDDAAPEPTSAADRATQSAHEEISRPAVLNLPIDLTDRRRRMVVAGLVSASTATPHTGREGR
jgi:hypothetical protein